MRKLKPRLFWAALVIASGSSIAALAAENDAVVHFDQTLAPILAKHCIACHNPTDAKGGLDLSTREAMLKGGESGPVVNGTDPLQSPLFVKIEAEEMPPDRKKYPGPTNDEKAKLKAWIESGAPWGSKPVDLFQFTTDRRAGADWWSLRPVNRPELPGVKRGDWLRNKIDNFVLAKLEAKGISPAEAASKRVLIRRVYFDLIGLPPSPAEVEAFESSTDELAYEKVVDHLLESVHYGERWARHWLDVVRYTESQGFEYDRLRPNAWHYRDYVIESLNDDKPYDIFLQEQIAGDVLNFESPESGVDPSGVVATSLLVCGPWDQAGNSQSNVTQKMITREDELEDLVGVIGQTFMGITVNCARCHTHKFDPISHADYYRFKSVFESVRHGERDILSFGESSKVRREAASHQRAIQRAAKELAGLEAAALKQATEKIAAANTAGAPVVVESPRPIARWSFEGNANDSHGSLHGELQGGASISKGRLVLQGKHGFLVTAPLAKEIKEKTLEAWVMLPNLDQSGGGVLSLESIGGARFDSIVFAERRPRMWMAGSNAFARTKDLEAPTEETKGPELIHMAIVYRDDATISVYRNGVPYGRAYQQGALETYRAGESHVLMGLRHTGAANGFLRCEIEEASLYDRALTEQEIANSFASSGKGLRGPTEAEMLAEMSEAERGKRTALVAHLDELRKRKFPEFAPMKSYVGIREGNRATKRLVRGDVKSPAEVVSPGGLSVIQDPPSDFQLPPDGPEAARRLKLAQWLANPRHPLTARVMMNRLWHYHFGRGIVDTPNDFGFNGGRPSHAELLDFLAAEFVAGKPAWSIKRMHKLILLSATYRQASTWNAGAAAIDAENTLLWRFSPRRLEGEVVRDAMLAVSGQLNRKVGGPSFQPFTIANFNSEFFTPTDPVGPEFNRRSIYRMNVNSGKSAFMDALDCPDPAIKTPVRRVTTTPISALALMNNTFVDRQSQRLAERMLAESKGDEAQAIGATYETVFGRKATDRELAAAAVLVKEHGLRSLCWALLNASEFLYVN